jgi:hypothetical protein
VNDARVRLREEGHVFIGDAVVAPKEGTEDVPGKIDAARRALLELDWRVHDLTIMPVKEITEVQHIEELLERG